RDSPRGAGTAARGRTSWSSSTIPPTSAGSSSTSASGTRAPGRSRATWSTPASPSSPAALAAAGPRLGRHAGELVGEHLAVAEVQRLDPALLTQGQRHEEAQLDQLRLAEVAV